jgi:hypothetical protein
MTFISPLMVVPFHATNLIDITKQLILLTFITLIVVPFHTSNLNELTTLHPFILIILVSFITLLIIVRFQTDRSTTSTFHVNNLSEFYHTTNHSTISHY